jgi:arylsulfatase
MKRRQFIQQTAAITSIISALGMDKSLAGASSDASSKNKNAKKPNILFIMTDQQRYDCIAANGNSIIKTPNLDRLAAQSANFSHAYVQSPVCTPSRACFFTGRYAHAHKNRVNYTELDDSERLMPQYLQQAGYKTGIIGKSHVYYNYPPTQAEAARTGFSIVELNDGVSRCDQFSSYVEWRGERDPKNHINYRALAKDVAELDYHPSKQDNPFRSAIDKDCTDTSWTGQRTRHHLREFAKSDQPFFLFSSFWKPHSPYEVPVPYDQMYSDIDIPLPEQITREKIEALPPHLKTIILRDELRDKEPPFDMDRERLQWIYRSYYATVSHIDDEVGKILDTLEESGLAENTIVIFTSDHGDQLLEHGLFGKNVFYESSVKIPFMMRYPGRINPGTYDEFCMSIDLLPTLFEFAGLEEPYNCHGQSLVPLISDSEKEYIERDCVFSENVIPEVFLKTFHFEKDKGVMGVRHPDCKMVRTKKWKFNYYPKGHQELFDLENDPDEMANLAADPGRAKIVDEMKSRLLDWLLTANETDQIAPGWLI